MSTTVMLQVTKKMQVWLEHYRPYKFYTQVDARMTTALQAL